MISLLFGFLAMSGEYVSIVKHPFEFGDEAACEEFAQQFEVKDFYPHLGTFVYECSNLEEIKKGY